jgi:hypothetical protein
MANKVYTLIYPDGREFKCRFSQVISRLERDFDLKASRELIQKRMQKYKDCRVLAAELSRPPLTQGEAGAIRWKKDKTQTQQPYIGVEGFDGPVSALRVWKTLVVEHGLKGPGRDTIKKRLKQGMRTRKALLDSYSTGRPKKGPLCRDKQVKKMNEDKEKKRNKTVMEIDEILSRVENMELTKCGHELPPMLDWIPDKNVYRRQPL